MNLHFKKGTRIKAFEFALWASTLPKPPTKEQIIEFMGLDSDTDTTARGWRYDWLKYQTMLKTEQAQAA